MRQPSRKPITLKKEVEIHHGDTVTRRIKEQRIISGRRTRITPLVNHFESQNLELSPVFPSLCLCASVGSTAEFRITHDQVYFSNQDLVGSLKCQGRQGEAQILQQRCFPLFPSLPSVFLTEGNEVNEEEGNRT